MQVASSSSVDTGRRSLADALRIADGRSGFSGLAVSPAGELASSIDVLAPEATGGWAWSVLNGHSSSSLLIYRMCQEPRTKPDDLVCD